MLASHALKTVFEKKVFFLRTLCVIRTEVPQWVQQNTSDTHVQITDSKGVFITL